MVDALAYCNGRLSAYPTVGMPLHDAGLVWGAAVTDLVRTFGHRLFRLSDHLGRFRQSCEICRAPLRQTDAELSAIAAELAAHNCKLLSAASDLALVMIATPGPIGYYLGHDSGPDPATPTLVMHTFELPFGRYRRHFSEGVRLVIPPTRQPVHDVVSPHAKQRSRMHWWIATQQAKDIDPRAEPLLLDAGGHVTETPSANLVAVIDGALVSPPRSSVLPGITLRVLRELAQSENLSMVERPLTPADCANADELMLTCTTWCLAGVSQLDGKSKRWPGPTYQKLLHAFSRYVGLDIEQQCRQ